MRRCAFAMVAVLIAAGPVSARAAAPAADWVEPMKQVHARFKG